MLAKRCVRAMAQRACRTSMAAGNGRIQANIARPYSGLGRFVLWNKDQQDDDDEEYEKEKTFKEKFTEFGKDPKKMGTTLLLLAATMGGLLSSEKIRDVLGIEFGFYSVIGIGVKDS